MDDKIGTVNPREVIETTNNETFRGPISSVNGGVPVSGNNRLESIVDAAAPTPPPISETAQAEDLTSSEPKPDAFRQSPQSEGNDITQSEVRNRVDSEIPTSFEDSNQPAKVPPTLGEVTAKDVNETPDHITPANVEVSPTPQQAPETFNPETTQEKVPAEPPVSEFSAATSIATPTEAPRPTVDAVSAGSAKDNVNLVKEARDESGAANLEAQIGGIDTNETIQDSSVASPTEALPTPEPMPENTAPQVSPEPPAAQDASQPIDQPTEPTTPNIQQVITPEDTSISEMSTEQESDDLQETIGQIYNLLDKLKRQIGNDQHKGTNPEIQSGQDKAT